ncbi:MAG: FAD-dependent oxidoreductase [Cyanobacteriota bacterium]|nr:FAD-dependent oxidoreductase [Cyanobacteriota bacterium]
MGAGIIGRAAAWRLAERRHPVTLVDPGLAVTTTTESAWAAPPAPGRPSSLSGSHAALGVLMARVFHRSSGRAWRLRQQSHALWNDWLVELERRGHALPRRQGLLLLAASSDELARQERIAADRERLAIPLRLLSPDELKELCPSLPGQALGGLLSPEDGQLDPEPVLEALLKEARQAGASCVAEAAVAVERGQSSRGRRWRLVLAGGGALEADWLVLASGLGAAPLLASLGLSLALEPVVGQALELELAAPLPWNWPGAVAWRGVNLVPRPPGNGGGQRLWLGATLEPGDLSGAAPLEEMRLLGGEAPTWLREARVVRHWQGLRCRPIGRAAPVLAEPEPRLLIATGHYRNGILLAPATAEWLCGRIQGMAGEVANLAAHRRLPP